MKKQKKSKKKFLLPLAVLTASLSIAALPALTGCNGDPDPGPGITTPTEDEVQVVINTVVNGTVTADASTYKKGDDITLTVTPANGYRLKSITVNSEDKTSSVADGKLVLSNVQDNTVTVSVAFELIPVPATVSVSVNNEAYGTASVDKTSCYVGDTVYVSITPADGYEVIAVMMGAVDVYDSAKITDGKLAVEIKDEEAQITVQFAKIVARLSLTVVGEEYGSATTEKTEYEIGETAVININVEDGGELYSLKVNGVDMADEVSEGKLEIAMESKGRVIVVAEFGVMRIGVNVSVSAKKFQSDYSIKGKTVTLTNVANSNIRYTATPDNGRIEIEKFVPGTYTVAVEGCVTKTVEIGGDAQITLAVDALDYSNVDISELAEGKVTPTDRAYWLWSLDGERLGNEFEIEYTVIAPDHEDNIGTQDERRVGMTVHFFNANDEEVKMARWDFSYVEKIIAPCPGWSGVPTLTDWGTPIVNFTENNNYNALETDGITINIKRVYDTLTITAKTADGKVLGTQKITDSEIADLNCRFEIVSEREAPVHRYENFNIVDTTPEGAIKLSQDSEYDETMGEITLTGGYGTSLILNVVPKEGNIVTELTVNGKAYEIHILGGEIDLGYWGSDCDDTITVSAVFEVVPVATVKVSVNNDAYGTATVDKTTCNLGETVYITITPATGYDVSAVLLGGKDVYASGEIIDGKLAVEITDADAQITVEFVKVSRVNLAVTAKKFQADYNINGKTVTLTNVQNGKIRYTAVTDNGSIEVDNFIPGTYTVAVEGCATKTVEIGGDAQITLAVNALDYADVDISALDEGKITPNEKTFWWLWTLDGERLGNEFEIEYTVIAPDHNDNVDTNGSRRVGMAVHFYNERNEEVKIARWDFSYAEKNIATCPGFGNTPTLTDWGTVIVNFNENNNYNALETDGITINIKRVYDTITFTAKTADGTVLGSQKITNSDIADLNCRFEINAESEAPVHRYENFNITDTTPKGEIKLSENSEYDRTKGEITLIGGYGTSLILNIVPKQGNIITHLTVNGIVHTVPGAGGEINFGYWGSDKDDTVTVSATFRTVEVKDIQASFTDVKNAEIILIGEDNKEVSYCVVNGVLSAQNFAEGIYRIKYSIFGKEYVTEKTVIADGVSITLGVAGYTVNDTGSMTAALDGNATEITASSEVRIKKDLGSDANVNITFYRTDKVMRRYRTQFNFSDKSILLDLVWWDFADDGGKNFCIQAPIGWGGFGDDYVWAWESPINMLTHEEEEAFLADRGLTIEVRRRGRAFYLNLGHIDAEGNYSARKVFELVLSDQWASYFDQGSTLSFMAEGYGDKAKFKVEIEDYNETLPYVRVNDRYNGVEFTFTSEGGSVTGTAVDGKIPVTVKEGKHTVSFTFLGRNYSGEVDVIKDMTDINSLVFTRGLEVDRAGVKVGSDNSLDFTHRLNTGYVGINPEINGDVWMHSTIKLTQADLDFMKINDTYGKQSSLGFGLLAGGWGEFNLWYNVDERKTKFYADGGVLDMEIQDTVFGWDEGSGNVVLGKYAVNILTTGMHLAVRYNSSTGIVEIYLGATADEMELVATANFGLSANATVTEMGITNGLNWGTTATNDTEYILNVRYGGTAESAGLTVKTN